MPAPRVFDFRVPPITMGLGARRRLPEIAASLGRRACVVTDPGMAAQSSFAECLTLLKGAGMAVSTFTDVAPDPPVRTLHECVAVARDAGADVLVGIGGGSSLDVTKLTAVMLRHDCRIEDLFGTDLVPGRGVPTVLMPTTAGTGSEVTPIAILADEVSHLKRGVVSGHLVADVAVVDPELCATLPPAPTAYTGMDALTHAVEAYTNKFAVPFVDTLAVRAIELIGANLPRAVECGTDLAAREAMSSASLYGGMCLGPVNTAAVHALAYPLGGRFDVPHGIANSLLLPHVMRFSAPAVGERYDRIGRLMGADDGVGAVERLSERVGTNRRMREFGVQETDLESMAAAAMEVTRLLVNNPREVTEADALAIYQAAW